MVPYHGGRREPPELMLTSLLVIEPFLNDRLGAPFARHSTFCKVARVSAAGKRSEFGSEHRVCKRRPWTTTREMQGSIPSHHSPNLIKSTIYNT